MQISLSDLIGALVSAGSRTDAAQAPSVASGMIGKGGVKPDTFYIYKNGVLVEADAA